MKMLKSIEIDNGFGICELNDGLISKYNVENVIIKNNLNLIHDPRTLQTENHYLEELYQYKHIFRASVKLINLQYKGGDEDYKAIVDIIIDSYLNFKTKYLYLFSTMQLVDDVDSFSKHKSVSQDNNYGSHYQFFQNPVKKIEISYDS